MLTILGEKQRFCDGVNRREFLKVGGLALGGLSLPGILAAEAQAGIRSSHKAIIMVYLPGGPPHLDMVDMKPDAPAEIRGPYKPVETNVSGIQISEHMPHMAKMMEMVVTPDAGTAPVAQIPGYRVAGKTGTAQVAEHGHYSTSKYTVSFAGFAPA